MEVNEQAPQQQERFSPRKAIERVFGTPEERAERHLHRAIANEAHNARALRAHREMNWNTGPDDAGYDRGAGGAGLMITSFFAAAIIYPIVWNVVSTLAIFNPTGVVVLVLLALTPPAMVYLGFRKFRKYEPR